MSSPSSPTLLSLLILDAAILGSPVVVWSSPALEIVSPRPIRRVSFDALTRLATAFEPEPVSTTTVAIANLLRATKIATTSKRDLLSGSTPEYGWRRPVEGGRFGVVGGERKGKGFGVIGGERGVKG